MKELITNDMIVLEIYRRMYAQAEPKADLDKMIKSGETKMLNFFLAYYMSQTKEKQITIEVLKEYDVPKVKRKAFFTEIFLGSAPCSNKTTTNNIRINYEEKLKQFLFDRKK